MTGPEHYAAAEALIEWVNVLGPEHGEQAAVNLAEAQVHATLALVAATVDANRHPSTAALSRHSAWQEAAS